jgi:hypothetical protein
MNELNQQTDSTATVTGRPGLAHTLGALMAATDAFKNVRAMALLALTFIGAALIGAAFGAIAGAAQMVSLVAVGGFLAMLVMFYGANAVGIMMMKDAQGQPIDSMMDAVLLSLFSSHRILAVFLLECAIVLLAVLAIVLVLFVCKIPVLGPLLYTVVFPASAILLGILVFALFYVMLPLTGPAVWNGGSVFQVIARLNLIVRARLIEVVLSQIVLFMIVSFVAFVIFGVLGTGFMMTAGISTGILGADSAGGAFGGISGMMTGGGGGGSGYAIAAGIGGGILMAIAAVVPVLMLTKGVCIIYLNTTRDMDFAASEAQLGEGLAAVKRRAEEARERARQLAQQQRPAGDFAPAGPAAAASVPTCPSCHMAVAPDDVFCGNCAHKLR